MLRFAARLQDTSDRASLHTLRKFMRPGPSKVCVALVDAKKRVVEDNNRIFRVWLTAINTC